MNLANIKELDVQGNVPLTAELVETVQQILEKNGVSYTLEADLSPKFVVGHVESLEQHPNADKLKVCQVNVGESTLQIVCGAPNVEAGQKVVVAKVGAVMPSGMVIKDAELTRCCFKWNAMFCKRIGYSKCS